LPNDGIFFEFSGATNFKFYGNILLSPGGSLMTSRLGTAMAGLIYNNIFEKRYLRRLSARLAQFGGTMDPSSEIANNIFENVDNQASPLSAITMRTQAAIPTLTLNTVWHSIRKHFGQQPPAADYLRQLVQPVFAGR
jgi:hypothetical protein